MFETELKFQVPAARWAALHKAVATRTAVKTRLQAMYVETPGHDLAAAGLALRLRKEGRVWVQTLKGRGDGLMQRLEHEVRLPPARAGDGLPQVDPSRHDGTPAGQALQKALAAAREAGRSDLLQTLYRTDIQRLHRRVRHGGAVVEIALDQGTLHAGAGDASALSLPVAEIEFELVSGPPQALAALAARWVRRFDLWWDVRTKSERGFRLALSLARVPATRAQPQVLPAGGLAPALAAMLQAALAQALPNLAEMAGAPADTPAAPEHLHQLRVALRRLRTALRLFAGWAPEPDAAHALEARWREVFTALGAARDADVLASTWLPRLQAAGAPAFASASAAAATDDVASQVREPAVTVLLLDTLALSLACAQPPAATAAAALSTPTAPADGRAGARAVLRRAWRQAWADARRFADAPVEQQHRARKRLKRLRYALEFLAPWLPARSLRRFNRALRRALEALGEHNDLHTARESFARQTAADPAAWFAVGWLAAQDRVSCESATRALARLKTRERPWVKVKGKSAA